MQLQNGTVSDTRDLFRAFFNGTTDSIVVVDAATNTVVDANPRAVTESGYRLDELHGAPVERLFRSPAELLAGSADNPGLLTKTGRAIAVTASVTPVIIDQGRYLFVVLRKPGADTSRTESEGGTDTWTEREDFPSIIGRSDKIHHVCRLIGSVAKSDATVLLQGESGTGKEIVANAIHAHSRRGRGPFVKVNCAALTESLLESELFGHVKGAFTGAIRDRRGRFKQADRGTILLDEIGSMPLSGQATLLRVLQEREFESVGSSTTTSVDVRVIAATNADLAKAVVDGTFRADLYYRLNVFGISLPPLRERPEDVALLAQHFLRRYTQTIGKRIRAIAPDTLAALRDHDWPGNVRELENAIEHAVIVEKEAVIHPGSLPMNIANARVQQPAGEPACDLGLRERLMIVERQILLETLQRAHGIRKRAAEMLGIDSRNMP